MNKSIGNTSIRKVVIITFMVTMLVSINLIGYFVFTSWFSSAKKTTEIIAEEMNKQIYNQLHSHLGIPQHIIENNHKIITNGILDLSDEENRDRFFIGVLNSHENEIYSFSCGTESGEYYGARRNEHGIVEIMRNNALTGGNSWYYSVTDDLTAGELAVKAGKFDPRTRNWYKEAIQRDGPTFSPIYKHFIMDDLTISHSSPVYDKKGIFQCVLGVHMLLNDVGSYLADTVSPYNGYAIIFEKDTNYLIANSMNADNFTVLEDGNLERYDMTKIPNFDFARAYSQYESNYKSYLYHSDQGQGLYINVEEIHMTGLDWVVISAIPEDYLFAPIIKSIHLAAILVILSLLLAFGTYILITKKLFKPMNALLQTADAFSSGNLSKRINIIRNDEIGKISNSFNEVADKMQFLVNNLEIAVEERTKELYKANTKLEENKNQLQLILDSAAGAIYGTDASGNCTFCNLSCVKILGYSKQDELLGKNMHKLIHHTKKDGTPLPVDDCKIIRTIVENKGTHVDDEVFWRADGTSFYAEYYSFPQVKNGRVIGAVVTFTDISDRKQKEAEIQYLSFHDTLTGLPNRRCFEENCERIDRKDNLPISVMFADINGLKMTNDIFGHAAGDELIKKTSDILRNECRHDDLVARIGGDEFIILLPRTTEKDARKIFHRIKSAFNNTHIRAIKCSISLGLATKHSPNQSLVDIMLDAENAMYKDKSLNRKSTNKEIINTIIRTLHAKIPREKDHSIKVSNFCAKIGEALQLDEKEISTLKKSAYLHDIGKIVLDDKLLSEANAVDNDEYTRQHAIVGYRILNLFDETLDLAEYVYSHHERWDGTGYPRGLKGEQIPLFSRIISVAESYDRLLNKDNLPLGNRKETASEAIKKDAGTRFDPWIVELFIQHVVNEA